MLFLAKLDGHRPPIDVLTAHDTIKNVRPVFAVIYAALQELAKLRTESMNTGILEFEDGPYQQGGEDGPWAFAIDAACLTEDGSKKVDHPMSANTTSEFGISKDSGGAQCLRDRLIAPRSVLSAGFAACLFVFLFHTRP